MCFRLLTLDMNIYHVLYTYKCSICSKFRSRIKGNQYVRRCISRQMLVCCVVSILASRVSFGLGKGLQGGMSEKPGCGKGRRQLASSGQSVSGLEKFVFSGWGFHPNVRLPTSCWSKDIVLLMVRSMHPNLVRRIPVVWCRMRWSLLTLPCISVGFPGYLRRTCGVVLLLPQTILFAALKL